MHVCGWIEKIKSHFRYWKQRQTQFFTSKFIPRIFGVSFSESFVQKMNDLSLWYIMIKLIFWYLEVKHNSLHHIIHQISYQSRHSFINHFHITDHYYIADDSQLSHSHWPSTNYTYLHIYIHICWMGDFENPLSKSMRHIHSIVLRNSRIIRGNSQASAYRNTRIHSYYECVNVLLLLSSLWLLSSLFWFCCCCWL